MNKLLLALVFSFAAGCASAPRIVATATDEIATVEGVAAAVVDADVVALGERHGLAPVHHIHRQLIEELHRLRPNLVVALEMFDRDVQGDLQLYLDGEMAEADFLAVSRPWKGYRADYRPVVEFARARGLVVLAANAPRDLAGEVAKYGIEQVLGNPLVARETSAPEDSYWDAFVEQMQDHAGLDDVGALRRYYQAQCLKDDTMAETIVDHLAACGEPRPLVVLICGQAHSDFRRGAVRRIADRMPDVDLRVLSVEVVEDIAAGVYTSSPDRADYVIVVPEPARSHAPAPEPAVEQEPAPEPAVEQPAGQPGSPAG